jgi:hypothetical protein
MKEVALMKMMSLMGLRSEISDSQNGRNQRGSDENNNTVNINRLRYEISS